MKRIGMIAFLLLSLSGCLSHNPNYQRSYHYHYTQPFYYYHRPVCRIHYGWNPYTHRYYPRRICY